MHKAPSDRAGFMRRLAYYAIGLAIGCMMLGMFQHLRTQEHRSRIAARGAAPTQPATQSFEGGPSEGPAKPEEPTEPSDRDAPADGA